MKVFLESTAGAVRSGTADSTPESGTPAASGALGRTNARTRSIEQAGRRIVRKGRAFKAKARRLGDDAGGIRPENVIWIFGGARTGSTWLSEMMGELKGHTVWNEPLVGALFGNLYYGRAKHLIGRPDKHYILGDGCRESWLDSIRTFVLKEATERFPEAVGPDNYLVVKEPNGSLGAPLLIEALPESRMILLIRDPRDVTASSMDARRKGGWNYEKKKGEGQESLVDRDPDTFIRQRARSYLEGLEKPIEAYKAYKGRKALVRYEDLRADTLGTMRHIYSELGMPVEEKKLAQAVEKYSWENIPEEEKGPGKKRRKATLGGWREDLTPEQAKTVERITAPFLEEFYKDTPRS